MVSVRSKSLYAALILAVTSCVDSEPSTVDGSTGGPTATSQLVFNEIFSWSLADPSRYVGAAILGDSAVLAWTEEGEMFMFHVARPEPSTVTGAPAVMSATVLMSPSNALVALVAKSQGSLLRVESDGVVSVSEMRCADLATAMEVISLPFGTLATGLGPTGEYVVTLSAWEAGGCETFAEAPSPCDLERPSLSVSRTDRFVALMGCSDPSRPLIGVSWDSTGLAFRPIERSVPVEVARSFVRIGPLWRGLPLLPLDGGYMRVVADVRTNTRRVEIWDDDGAHRQTVISHVPFGLVASAPDRKLLVGMRGGSEFRLILMRWDWLSDGRTGASP